MPPSWDQTGVPGLVLFAHFHSSTTSRSASLMSLRILLKVSPRQSPSSAILLSISSDGDWPSVEPDSFMFSSKPRRDLLQQRVDAREALFAPSSTPYCMVVSRCSVVSKRIVCHAARRVVTGAVVSAARVLSTRRVPPLQRPARDLDSAGDRERDPEREQEALPGRVLERVPAEVAEERGVERPADCCGGVEEDEAAPRKLEELRAQGDGRPPARNEARDRNQLSAALGQLALGPFDPPPRPRRP